MSFARQKNPICADDRRTKELRQLLADHVENCPQWSNVIPFPARRRGHDLVKISRKIVTAWGGYSMDRALVERANQMRKARVPKALAEQELEAYRKSLEAFCQAWREKLERGHADGRPS